MRTRLNALHPPAWTVGGPLPPPNGRRYNDLAENIAKRRDESPPTYPDAFKRGNFWTMTENQPSTQEKSSEPLSFEQSLERLEEIVRLLEDGQLGLNDSLGRYEEGVKLLRQAYELLERAETQDRIAQRRGLDGNPITRPLEDISTLERDEGKGAARGDALTRSREPVNQGTPLRCGVADCSPLG